MADTTEDSKDKKNKGSNKLVIFVIIALLVGGGLGYVLGGNAKESELHEKYDKQVQTLEKDLDAAKVAAGITVDDGKEAVTEGQQTIESLQAENAALKTTVSDQNKKIADLEKQLEEAKKSDDTTTP